MLEQKRRQRGTSTTMGRPSIGRYAERLGENPDMTLMYEGSTRFEGTTQLVRMGLMQDTDAWADVRASAGSR